MSRSSHIKRMGLGAAVIKLHSSGATAPMIAATVGHGVTDSQVHRYVQKHDKLTAVSYEMQRANALGMVVAAVQGMPDRRDRHTEGIEYFGAFEVPTTNIFGWYYDVCRAGVSGQVEAGFAGLALKLTAGARIVGEESKQPELDILSNSLDFPALMKDVARSMMEMGTVVVITRNDNNELIKPVITPINYITLLTDNETVGSVDEDLLIKGEITQIVHGEGTDTQHIYTLEETALFRRWWKTNYFTDVLNRNTYGLYGMSMVPGISGPLKSMLNASYRYDQFLDRYGIGRLHIDMKMIAELLKADTITGEDATTMQESEAAAVQGISPNQDLVTMGDDVKMIETKQAFDITKYLAYRESQINTAMGISDIAAGKVGSAWTDSGTNVSDQEMLALTSMRDILTTTMFTEILTPHLLENNIKPEDVTIFTDPLSQVNVSHRDLLDASDRGVLKDWQVRERMGFPRQEAEDM